MTFPYLLEWGAVLSSGFDAKAGDVFCRNIAENWSLRDIKPINVNTHPNFTVDEYIWITHFDCKGYV